MSSSQVLPQIGLATSRAELVAESIRTAILNRTLKSGDVLVERQLADQLGVSKTPVREALIMLARSGLLTSTRGRGVTVRSLSYTEIRHVYEERILLEPWSLRSVIEGGKSDFAESRQALKESAAHAERGDQAARALANRRFHRGLFSHCENSLIVDVLDGLHDMVALAAVTVFWEEWSSGDAESKEHEAILEAALSGNGQKAEALLRAHIKTSVERSLSAEKESQKSATPSPVQVASDRTASSE